MTDQELFIKPINPLSLSICTRLMVICGARPMMFELAMDLARYLDGETTEPYEYRFQGSLGFGGKIYFGHHRGLYVSCYREDETPDRKSAIGRMNAWLDSEVNPSIRGER